MTAELLHWAKIILIGWAILSIPFAAIVLLLLHGGRE